MPVGGDIGSHILQLAQEVWPPVAVGDETAKAAKGLDQASLHGAASREIELPLQEPPSGPGASEEENPGDRRDAGALRLSAHPCAATSGGLDGECQAGEPAVSRDGPATAEQIAETEGAMDFVHHQLFDATKVRVLTVLDAFTKYSPAIEPRFNCRGTGVVEVLERVCKSMGFPRTIRVDQGPEFISKDLDLWAYW